MFFLPYDQVPLSSAGGKKSIFARQIAAQRLKEGKTPLHCAPEHTEPNLPPETSMDTDQCDAADDREQTWAILHVTHISADTSEILKNNWIAS